MRIVAIGLLAIFPSVALAQSRPSTTSMTCQAARAFIQARQAVVMSTGHDLYDRYVANDGQCLVGQEAHPAFAPTTDNPQCQIGLRCVEISINEK